MCWGGVSGAGVSAVEQWVGGHVQVAGVGVAHAFMLSVLVVLAGAILGLYCSNLLAARRKGEGPLLSDGFAGFLFLLSAFQYPSAVIPLFFGAILVCVVLTVDVVLALYAGEGAWRYLVLRGYLEYELLSFFRVWPICTTC
jgi:hypothetical protein